MIGVACSSPTRRTPRGATLLVSVLLTALVSASPGCGDAGMSASPTDIDEWGENETPATRDEILAAPSEFDADAVASALVDVADTADTSALPRVLALISDDREEIRWHAARALQAIGGDEATAALARLAREDASELVRSEAGDQ